MALSLEQLKAASGLKTKDVPCPELGGDVRIAKLQGARGLVVRQFFYSPEDAPLTKDQKAAALIELVAASVVDEAGVRILDSQAGREVIASMDDEALNRIGGDCLELNNMVEVKKNLPPTSDSSSSSA